MIGIPSVLYIDDLQSQIAKQSDPEKLRKSDWYFRFLRQFGLIFNSKSLLAPATVFKYLGYLVDLPEQEILPTPLRIEKCWTAIEKVMFGGIPTQKNLEELQGRLINLSDSPFTSFVVRQLGQVISSLERKKEIDLPSEIEAVRRLLIEWTQRTPNLLMESFQTAKSLHQHTLHLKGALGVVTDASEVALGGFSSFFQASRSLDPENPEHEITIPLPENLHQASSSRRELFGIEMHLKQLQKQEHLKKADGLHIYSDNKGVVYSLVRGSSIKPLNNEIVRRIHNLLRSIGKPVHFLWHRRDHRYLEQADKLSKPYLIPQVLTTKFQEQFPKKNWYYLPLHETFSVDGRTTVFQKRLWQYKPNLIFVPHHVVKMQFWTKALSEIYPRKRKWACLVAPLWSSKNLSGFVKKFGVMKLHWSDIFQQRPPSFIKDHMILCANFSVPM